MIPRQPKWASTVAGKAITILGREIAVKTRLAIASTASTAILYSESPQDRNTNRNQKPTFNALAENKSESHSSCSTLADLLVLSHHFTWLSSYKTTEAVNTCCNAVHNGLWGPIHQKASMARPWWKDKRIPERQACWILETNIIFHVV